MNLKWRTFILVSVAELLAMSLWFSASAIAPALQVDWHLDQAEAAWMTMSVQLGFVVGAFLSALFNLADRLAPRFVFAAGAILGAAATALLPQCQGRLLPALALRLLTGACLAAVYPVGMKIMTSWSRKDRGLALGLLVGALTVGSATPHLVKAFGEVRNWESVLYSVAVLAMAGGLLGLLYGKMGPYRSPRASFQWRFMEQSLRRRPLRLANFGYLGHMWELYAMWTWIPLFLLQVYRSSADQQLVQWLGPERLAALVSFLVIGLGGAGSLAAGWLADRWGRTRTTIVSLALSGSCALTVGFLMNFPTVATLLSLLWGLSVVADSAQFSTSISELGESTYVGTLLTTQTCMGFLLTLISIRLVPSLAQAWGWNWAFAVLAAGPLFGIQAMRSLKRSPWAAHLAGGRG